MKQILQEISQLALLLKDEDFTQEQVQSGWLGNPPATQEEIDQLQQRLQINLPADYVEFLKICNGFAVYSDVHPSFAPASQIDYLKNIDEELIDIWGTYDEPGDVTAALAQSIKVGGFEEEQYFLLIPPGDEVKEWRYWEFASWLPGESPFNDLTHFFTQSLAFLKKSAAEEGLIPSDIVIDYTLRNQLFALDWEGAYATAADLFLHNKNYHYLSNAPIVDLLHLMASKLNRYDDLADLIRTAYTTNEDYKIVAHVYTPLEQQARNKVDFMQKRSVEDREDRPALKELLVQTKKLYPQMFDDERSLAGYLLVQLFQGGKAADYIQMYESNHATLSAWYHLNAAIIYAEGQDAVKARHALNIYFEMAFNKTPLAPFCHAALVQVMDKEYLQNILQKFKQ